MTGLCCLTGRDLFDAWTIIHLGFWIWAGSFLWVKALRFGPAVGLGLLGAALWEIAEALLAPRYPKLWLDPEVPMNSWIGDPLTAVVAIAVVWQILDNRPRKKQRPKQA